MAMYPSGTKVNISYRLSRVVGGISGNSYCVETFATIVMYRNLRLALRFVLTDIINVWMNILPAVRGRKLEVSILNF